MHEPRAPSIDAAATRCEPCSTGTPALQGDDLARVRSRVREEWQVVADHHLEREFRFRNFRDALAFANSVGDVAERLGHHPEMLVGWGRVRLTLWTHKSHGLTESDFALASEIDAVHASAGSASTSPKEVSR
jgi:4a-hydroxytetrahydrobiopterin dehydratase